MLTRTRLVISEEPNPLSAVKVRTVSWLFPRVDLLLDRIDGDLDANKAAGTDLLADAEKWRTRLQHEPTPMVLPVASAPTRTPAPPAPLVQPPPPRTAHLDRCITELQEWLGAGMAAVCSAAGINRGTVYAWRERDSDPRPGTVAGVLRLHGLVSSAVRAAGENRAREWFHVGDPSPLDRLKAANGDAAVATAVSRELRRALTGPPLPAPNPLLAVTLDDSPARPLA